MCFCDIKLCFDLLTASQLSNLVHNQNASIKQRGDSKAEADEEVAAAVDDAAAVDAASAAAAVDAAAAAPAMLPETCRHDEVEERWVSWFSLSYHPIHVCDIDPCSLRTVRSTDLRNGGGYRSFPNSFPLIRP